MAEAVVHGLEVVEVEEKHRQRTGDLRMAMRHGGVVDEATAVGQTGEEIVDTPGTSAALRAPPGRHVALQETDEPGQADRHEQRPGSRSRPRRPQAAAPCGPRLTGIGPVTIATTRRIGRTGPSQVTATGCGSVRRTIDGYSAVTPKSG